MQEFRYAKPADLASALSAVGGPSTRVLAGGTELLNWMRDGIESPGQLVDITALPLDLVEATAQGLDIGALARMSDVAAHPTVRRDYPVLAQALELAASPQIRNLATIGGNLLQRTRCPYFRSETPLPCNKRTPGTGCAARHGENRTHAIFGWSDACVATHPSDLAVALAALDAVVHVVGTTGERAIPVTDFHRLPDNEPERETVLDAGELILGIEVPAAPSTRQSYYLKVRERASYEFAMVSAAVTLELDGGGRTIAGARIALGGVAHKPWRLGEAERSLRGAPYRQEALAAAVGGAFAGARPLEQNGFKVPLAKRAVVRALEHAGGLA
jgi:xanthine dehydrogenase YagS FAD-binding subunit